MGNQADIDASALAKWHCLKKLYIALDHIMPVYILPGALHCRSLVTLSPAPSTSSRVDAGGVVKWCQLSVIQLSLAHPHRSGHI